MNKSVLNLVLLLAATFTLSSKASAMAIKINYLNPTQSSGLMGFCSGVMINDKNQSRPPTRSYSYPSECLNEATTARSQGYTKGLYTFHADNFNTTESSGLKYENTLGKCTVRIIDRASGYPLVFYAGGKPTTSAELKGTLKECIADSKDPAFFKNVDFNVYRPEFSYQGVIY